MHTVAFQANYPRQPSFPAASSTAHFDYPRQPPPNTHDTGNQFQIVGTINNVPYQVANNVINVVQPGTLRFFLYLCFCSFALLV